MIDIPKPKKEINVTNVFTVGGQMVFIDVASNDALEWCKSNLWAFGSLSVENYTIMMHVNSCYDVHEVAGYIEGYNDES